MLIDRKNITYDSIGDYYYLENHEKTDGGGCWKVIIQAMPGDTKFAEVSIIDHRLQDVRGSVLKFEAFHDKGDFVFVADNYEYFRGTFETTFDEYEEPDEYDADVELFNETCWNNGDLDAIVKVANKLYNVDTDLIQRLASLRCEWYECLEA